MHTIQSVMRRIFPVFISAMLAAALLSGGAGIAAAAGLFEAASSVDMRNAPAAPRAPQIIRDRLVRLVTGELERHVAPSAADTAADRIERAKSLDGVILIELFPNVRITARRTDVEAPPEGGYVWTGESSNGQPGWVTLVIKNNQIVGNVQFAGRLFSIEPVTGAMHRVIEIDQNKIPKDIHPPAIPQQLLQKGGAATPEPDDRALARKSTINVYVAYTANARAEVGGASQMLSQIDLALSLTSTAYRNSGVQITMRRVGSPIEVNYDEASLYGGLNTSTNYTAMLCDLSGLNCGTFGWNPPVNNNQTAAFNGVRSQRDANKADLVVMMRKQGSACGIAWVPDPPTSASSIYGFAVVTSSPSYGCISGNTFAHETGHNQGLHHDRYVEPSAPASRSNYGYVDTVGRFRDIMSYPDKCTAAGVSCTRVPYFSTPRKTYGGRPLGIARGKPEAADATRTLNETRTTTEAYR